MLSRPPPDDDAERELAELRAIYAAELPGLIQRLAELSADAPCDPQAAREAKNAAHRLRGTAGSYGFSAVTEIAGKIEDAIEGDRAAIPDLIRALIAQSPAHSSSSGSSK